MAAYKKKEQKFMNKQQSKKQETTKNFLLPIPTDLHLKLKLYSIEHDKMIRESICEAIKEYLQARKAL